MLKKYIPFLLCLLIGLILVFFNLNSSNTKHINTYPNLPAPIGEEKILITSAGQAIEGTIIFAMADSLNLDADYRPRALDTDLYDYQSVIIVLGYSSNGLSYINRSFRDELHYTEQLVKEAASKQLPLVIINLSGVTRNDEQTWKLFEKTVEYSDYYIGLKSENGLNRYMERLKELKVPVTLVNELDDMPTPLNSAFR